MTVVAGGHGHRNAHFRACVGYTLFRAPSRFGASEGYARANPLLSPAAPGGNADEYDEDRMPCRLRVLAYIVAHPALVQNSMKVSGKLKKQQSQL
jgi:hypothetical protein